MPKVRICTTKDYPAGTEFKKKRGSWTSHMDGEHYIDIKTFKGGVQILNNMTVRIAVSRKVARQVFGHKQ